MRIRRHLAASATDAMYDSDSNSIEARKLNIRELGDNQRKELYTKRIKVIKYTVEISVRVKRL